MEVLIDELMHCSLSFLFQFTVNTFDTHELLTKTTPEFGGFSILISVELVHVQIIADMSLGTQLKEFYMEIYTGTEHLECQFKCETNLTLLSIIRSEEIDWQMHWKIASL